MRVGLVVPVAVSKVAFFGNVFVSLASFGLVLCGVVFVGRKRRWKTGRTLFVIFLLTFASVMIYSFIVEMPKAYASQTDAQLQQEKVYYFYEDHIGKPILMSEYEDYDGDGNLYYREVYDSNCQPGESTYEIWRTNFEPFGVDDYSFNSAGIDVGAGEDCHSTLEGWLPPFRFPGQYADPELLEDFVYNHWRFYMPEIGRYTSPDPFTNYEILFNKGNFLTLNDAMRLNKYLSFREANVLLWDVNNRFSNYIYVQNMPLMLIDPFGLWTFGWKGYFGAVLVGLGGCVALGGTATVIATVPAWVAGGVIAGVGGLLIWWDWSSSFDRAIEEGERAGKAINKAREEGPTGQQLKCLDDESQCNSK